jgi:hypothetical protein
MDVVDSRGETNDKAVFNGNRDVMPGVFKKFSGEMRVDWIVEDFCGGIHENAVVAALQDLDFDGHSVASPTNESVQGRPHHELHNTKS